MHLIHIIFKTVVGYFLKILGVLLYYLKEELGTFYISLYEEKLISFILFCLLQMSLLVIHCLALDFVSLSTSEKM